MAPCLCAPTTHEGSFRCRFHRGLPSATSPAQFASKGACPAVSSREIAVVKACLVREHESPSDQLKFDWHASSPTGKSLVSLSSTPLSRLASSSSAHSSRHARPPPARRSISPSTLSTSPSSYTGSSTSSATSSTKTTASARSTNSPSISHAAALAIMKQHMHSSRSHVNRRYTMPRSSAGYKIGPSRLSRMGRATSAEEIPVHKKVDYSIPNFHVHDAFEPETAGLRHSVQHQTRQSTAMESSPRSPTMHSAALKYKQNESPCKIVGYKAGHFMVPTVY